MEKNRKKIMIITGTRAEYGILKPVLNAIERHPRLILSLVATGMHLLHEFGCTVNEIEKDGFKVDFKINMLSNEDSKEAMAKSLARGIFGMVRAIKKSNPDIVFVCGDRSEALAAAIAAAYLTVPVAHLMAGDTTIGSTIDDSIRPAITKFAHIHFAATKKHAERVIKLGEEPWRVFVTGSPVIDAIRKIKRIPPKKIAQKFNLNLKNPIILLIQHPTTINVENAPDEIRETLEAIIRLKYQTLLVYPNADAGGRRMIQVVKEYEKFPFIRIFKSIPWQEYLSLMNITSVMVGNSSSGIIEAPSFGLPVVNIGPRELGRERANNIIDVDYKNEDIEKAIKKAIYDKNFREKVKRSKNPYGDGRATERIIKVLTKIKINRKLIQKKMTY